MKKMNYFCHRYIKCYTSKKTKKKASASFLSNNINMIPIAIIAVVLILFMLMFMAMPAGISNSCSGGGVSDEPVVGYTVLGESHEEGSEHRILAIRYGDAEPFLAYNSLRTLGRWNLFCGHEYMKTRKHRPSYAIGFNLSMELQQFLDKIHLVPRVSLEDLLRQFPESGQDSCDEVYQTMIKANELTGHKFIGELQAAAPGTAAANVMKNNFTCKNDHTKLYSKKVTVGDAQFDVNYMKVTLLEHMSNLKFILYYVDYTVSLPRFAGKRYNAPIYIEYDDGKLNQYGMNKPWVNPYSYVPNIIEHPNQAPVSGDDRSIGGDYVFVGDMYTGMWPLLASPTF
jgi:hypothetical protein